MEFLMLLKVILEIMVVKEVPSNSLIGRSKGQINGKYRGLVGKVAVVKGYSRRLTDSEVLKNYRALKSRFGL